MTDRKQLVTAIEKLLEKSKDSKQLALAIAAYLLETRQTKDAGALLRDLEALRLNKKGVLEVHVTSAHRLNESSLQGIKKLFDAKHIIIHEEQDPRLLGGVKVRAHDQRLDYSVRTRLQRLKAGI
jgi:F-type H+-transporting ATPase subunit delta